MEIQKVYAIQRYYTEQIHLDQSARYEGGFQSSVETKATLKGVKSKPSNEQEHDFQDLLDSEINKASEH